MARIVIALGGNALGNTPAEQRARVAAACPALVGLIHQGHEIIVSHGNGPQVGMIQTAFDAAAKTNPAVAPMPLPECTAMSQGYIGYHLQQGLRRALRAQGMPWQVATVVTQVVVDPDDPAFCAPAKPIGAFYDAAAAQRMQHSDPTLHMREDSGRGWRRVVASPKPVDIVERRSILNLLDNEYIVIACGGGGVPVARDAHGDYFGVDAVIDKDFASACLAEAVGADYLFILTAVDHVCLNFGTPEQRALDVLHAGDAERYLREGQFGAGSMQPKVAAAAQRLRQTPVAQQRLAVRTVEDLALAVDPHGAEPLGVRGQHEVFEHAAAVGHVVCAPAVAEHDHDHRRAVVGVDVLADHGGVELREPVAVSLRLHGDDRRRLLAHGGRGIGAGLEHAREHVRGHGVRLVGADAAPGHYECQKIVCHTMTSVQICYGQYITNRARVVYCWQISGFSAGLAERSAHMIFHITRLILWLLPSAVGVHGIRASACRRKRLCCALCVLFFLLLASLSAVLPVENLFLHFRTPERAFAYQHMGKIEHILYGEDSCFVLYKNENGADSDCILPKTAAGYLLSTRWTKQGIVRTPITSSSFLRAEVYQARGTQDFYIYCEKFPPEALEDIRLFRASGEPVDADVYLPDVPGYAYIYVNGFSAGDYLVAGGEKLTLEGWHSLTALEKSAAAS